MTRLWSAASRLEAVDGENDETNPIFPNSHEINAF